MPAAIEVAYRIMRHSMPGGLLVRPLSHCTVLSLPVRLMALRTTTNESMAMSARGYWNSLDAASSGAAAFATRRARHRGDSQLGPIVRSAMSAPLRPIVDLRPE